MRHRNQSFGPLADWDATTPKRLKARRRIVAIAALAGAAFGVAGQGAAHAADDQPLKKGWSYQLMDGSTIGTPAADPYEDVCSEVTNPLERRYGVAYGPQNNWSGPVYDLTYDQMIEHKNTVFKDDPRAEIIWVQGLDKDPEIVVPCSEMKVGHLYEIDKVLKTHTIPPGQPNHGTDDDIKPKPQPEPTPTPTTPAPQPTPVETPKPTPTAPPAKPVPSTPAVKYVVRTFQVDRAVAKTAKAATAYAALDNDGKLTRAEGRKLWSSVRETAQFVTVKVPVKASAAQVLKAINARTGAVGDVTTTAKLDKLKAGQVVTQAWELSSRASAKAPFGRTGLVAQTYVGRSVVR